MKLMGIDLPHSTVSCSFESWSPNIDQVVHLNIIFVYHVKYKVDTLVNYALLLEVHVIIIPRDECLSRYSNVEINFR